MSIYRGSRYTKTNLYFRDTGKLCFKIRERFNINTDNARTIIYKEGDTLYNLAHRYYGNTQLWWAILDTNPDYRWEGDIPYGAELIIPDYNEVMKCLQKS